MDEYLVPKQYYLITINCNGEATMKIVTEKDLLDYFVDKPLPSFIDEDSLGDEPKLANWGESQILIKGSIVVPEVDYVPRLKIN